MLASTTRLSGRSLIGFRQGAAASNNGTEMFATNPTTGERLQPAFIPASAEEVDLAAHLAADAFEVYQRISGRERGAFLRTIAAKIELIAPDVVDRGAGDGSPAGPPAS